MKNKQMYKCNLREKYILWVCKSRVSAMRETSGSEWAGPACGHRPPAGWWQWRYGINTPGGLPRKGHLTPVAVQLGPPSPDLQLSKLRGNTTPGLNSATSSWPSHLPLNAHRPATCPGPLSRRKKTKCCLWQCFGSLQERPCKSGLG